ncbi:dihydrodipicolinate synthase family protein [Egicoccus halophilus]|uniref:Dihydrodipicolinate synthase family protein n=1 Tax=Egicoccus halophilus TaxID=1670830 RepID=A0A8J3ABJ3_9ACTN|nr:dihydrodipicolinate synthase family protein [Egicoccus halophilus]GGI09717.1 dihydrodipicolinate synthase family protein [Egicoccus halophilus]
MAIFRTQPFLPTAFHDDATLDLDGQSALAATTAAAGVDGVAVLGTGSGEPGALRLEEVADVVAATRRGAAGLPVAVGLASTGPGALPMARAAASAGADLLVAAVPAGADRGEALTAVAELGVPLWLHHVPAVTGARLDAPALLALAEDLGAGAVVVEAAPPGDLVAGIAGEGRPATLGGLAGLFLPEEVEAGALGTTAGSAVPERLGALASRYRAEDPAAAWDAYLELLPWLRLEVGSPGLRVRKEAWRQRGVLGSARVREGTPLGTATKIAVTRRLRQVGVEVRAPYPGA